MNRIQFTDQCVMAQNSDDIGLLAITNGGNTCFANAGLQLLTMLNGEWADAAEGDNPLYRELVDMTRTKWDPADNICIAGNKLIAKLWLNMPKGSIIYGQQQDAHEFIKRFLDSLDKDELVKQLFWAESVYITTCKVCGRESRRAEYFDEFQVYTPGVTLDMFFKNRFEPESIEGYECEECTMCDKTIRGPAIRQFYVRRWPPYLMFHVARFDPVRMMAKNTDSFEFHHTFRSERQGEHGFSYQLLAMLVHLGTTGMGGHYVTYGRLPDHRWILYDDNLLRPVDRDDLISTQVIDNVYVLLYKRVE